MSPTHHSLSRPVAGPTIRGRIPARPVSPFEDGYELSERYCGYKARGGYAPVTIELALPGEYCVSAWLPNSSAPVVSRNFHVTPLFP